MQNALTLISVIFLFGSIIFFSALLTGFISAEEFNTLNRKPSSIFNRIIWVFAGMSAITFVAIFVLGLKSYLFWLPDTTQGDGLGLRTIVCIMLGSAGLYFFVAAINSAFYKKRIRDEECLNLVYQKLLKLQIDNMEAFKDDIGFLKKKAKERMSSEGDSELEAVKTVEQLFDYLHKSGQLKK